MEFVILAVVIALVAVGVISGLVVSGRKKKQLPPAPSSTPTITPPEPHVGEEAETPGDVMVVGVNRTGKTTTTG